MHLTWYLARSSGMVSWGLLFLSVMFGGLLSTRLMSNRPRPPWLLDIHRFLGGLAVVFLVIHLAAISADSYVHFSLSSLLVPLVSNWRPIPVAWGVVSMYLLLGIEITSLLMKRLPKPLWRRIHRTSPLLFILTTIHGLTSGADAGTAAALWTGAATSASVGFLVFVRWLSPRSTVAKGRRATRASAIERASLDVPSSS